MDKKTKMKEKKASGIWKKVLGICLAVIMVIGMTMPAWAQIDAESKGSIKVTADESGWTASATTGASTTASPRLVTRWRRHVWRRRSCTSSARPGRWQNKHEKSPTLVDQTKSGIFREKER